MIEGLRVLPWFQDAHKETEHLKDCSACQENNPESTRKAMGCGWLAPSANARPWKHRAIESPEVETCPGYTCALPEVVDLAFHVYPHWDKSGGWTSRWSDNDPPGSVPDAIEVLHDSILQFRAWRMKNPEDK